jgi:hypothetical protein
MARVLIIATHACEDPTRAGLAFVTAKGSIEAGHKPEILLAGDGALLGRRDGRYCDGPYWKTCSGYSDGRARLPPRTTGRNRQVSGQCSRPRERNS